MADPKLSKEGNLRLAGLIAPGYPADPWPLIERVHELVDEQDIDPYGPGLLWFGLPPGDEPPLRWECVVGQAVVGLPRPNQGLVVEDYRNLVALTLPHPGPIADLSLTWRRLDDHGRSLGHRVRPYWRLALRSKRLADGNLLPSAEVSVFLER